MIDTLEYKGFWFLPGDKENRIPGVLKYSKGRAPTIEFFGSFNNFHVINTSSNQEIIQGITSDSKVITLYKCYVLQLQGAKLVSDGESGIPTSTYQVFYILEGHHFDTPEDIVFKKVISEIHNLDEWLGVSGFQPIGPPNDFNDIEINIDYKLPRHIDFAISDDVNGRFNFTVVFPDTAWFRKQVTLKQKVSLHITSKTELALADLLKHVICFQNFLVLALYNRAYPNSIKFIWESKTGEKEATEVKLYFSIANHEVKHKEMQPYEMFFPYTEVKAEFPEIIKDWYAKYSALEPAYNLLFEHFYNDEIFNENTFLNLAQAAETFHARIHNHTKMTEQDYDEMKNEIMASAPAKYHDWLDGQFAFGNSLNLHTRLTELIEKYSSDVLNHYLGDMEQFVKQVKWARNYYTHYSASLEKKALKGSQLFYLSMKLKILLVCSFLIEIGFDREKLKPLIERNKTRFLPHLLSGL